MRANTPYQGGPVAGQVVVATFLNWVAAYDGGGVTDPFLLFEAKPSGCPYFFYYNPLVSEGATQCIPQDPTAVAKTCFEPSYSASCPSAQAGPVRDSQGNSLLVLVNQPGITAAATQFTGADGTSFEVQVIGPDGTPLKAATCVDKSPPSTSTILTIDSNCVKLTDRDLWICAYLGGGGACQLPTGSGPSGGSGKGSTPPTPIHWMWMALAFLAGVLLYVVW